MEEINIDEIGLVSNDVHQISLVDWSDVSSIVKFKSEFKDYLVIKMLEEKYLKVMVMHINQI